MNFPRHLALALGTMVLLGSPAHAGDLDGVINPMQDAETGEWVEHKTSIESETPLGPDLREVSSKMSIVEVDGFRVAVQVNSDAQEGEYILHLDSSQSYLSLLTGSYDDVEILDSSVRFEEIEVNGKTYKAKNVHLVFTAKTDQSGMTIPVRVDQRNWVSLEVPVNGLVRSESKIEMEIMGQKMTQNTRTEIVGSSSRD
jgi:hypothetical protein